MKVDIFNTDKKYQIIYADPPWQYSDKGCNGACEAHYSTMKIDDICALPIDKISEKDCILFMWATYPMLKEALQVIESWGFKYKTIGFQWIKQNRSGKGRYFGLGRWTRGNTEPCLIAVKGKPSKYKESNAVSQIIEYPLTRHSEKPPITRDKIVELTNENLNKIELFARQAAEGWDCWGNEV